jgi:hypothetical protein
MFTCWFLFFSLDHKELTLQRCCVLIVKGCFVNFVCVFFGTLLVVRSSSYQYLAISVVIICLCSFSAAMVIYSSTVVVMTLQSIYTCREFVSCTITPYTFTILVCKKNTCMTYLLPLPSTWT